MEWPDAVHDLRLGRGLWSGGKDEAVLQDARVRVVNFVWAAALVLVTDFPVALLAFLGAVESGMTTRTSQSATFGAKTSLAGILWRIWRRPWSVSNKG